MKRAYVKHQYAGPKVNRKRSRAALQHVYGLGVHNRASAWKQTPSPTQSNNENVPLQSSQQEKKSTPKTHEAVHHPVSRTELWRKTKKRDDNPKVPSSSKCNKIVKTYSRIKKKDHIEANHTQNEQMTLEKEPTISKSLNINRPLIDSIVDSHELIKHLYIPSDNLGGLSGNTQNEQMTLEQEPTISKSLNINRPLIDSTVDSHELTEHVYIPSDNLGELSGSTQNEQMTLEKDPTISKSLNINPPLIDSTVDSHELIEHVYIPSDNLGGLSGNRIVDLPHVLQWAFKLERHRSECKGSSIIYVDELKNGFNSIFIFICSMCGTEFRNSNENTEKINKGFVWGTLTAGSCFAQAAHITNLMDIPTMSEKKFHKTEILLSDVWKDYTIQEIQKNGEQGEAMAIEENNVSKPMVLFHML